MRNHSRRLGVTHCRRASSKRPSATLPTTSRPKVNGPGSNVVPIDRIAMNAEAQATTVIATALSTGQLVRARIGVSIAARVVTLAMLGARGSTSLADFGQGPRRVPDANHRAAARS